MSGYDFEAERQAIQDSLKRYNDMMKATALTRTGEGLRNMKFRTTPATIETKGLAQIWYNDGDLCCEIQGNLAYDIDADELAQKIVALLNAGTGEGSEQKAAQQWQEFADRTLDDVKYLRDENASLRSQLAEWRKSATYGSVDEVSDPKVLQAYLESMWTRIETAE